MRIVSDIGGTKMRIAGVHEPEKFDTPTFLATPGLCARPGRAGLEQPRVALPVREHVLGSLA